MPVYSENSVYLEVALPCNGKRQNEIRHGQSASIANDRLTVDRSRGYLIEFSASLASMAKYRLKLHNVTMSNKACRKLTLA